MGARAIGAFIAWLIVQVVAAVEYASIGKHPWTTFGFWVFLHVLGGLVIGFAVLTFAYLLQRKDLNRLLRNLGAAAAIVAAVTLFFFGSEFFMDTTALRAQGYRFSVSGFMTLLPSIWIAEFFASRLWPGWQLEASKDMRTKKAD